MTEPVRRNNFFFGKVMTAEHFQVEQDYHRDMRHRQNQLLGSGVVTGLDVSVDEPGSVVVSSGWAIDPLGREIVLTEPIRLEAAQTGAAELVVTAKWAQELAGPVPTLDGSDDAQYEFVEERPTIELVESASLDPLAVILAEVRCEKDSLSQPVLNRRALLRPASGSSGA